MKKVKLLLMVGFVLTLGIIGCKKGDTGPAGATGPAGPDSVVYSPWIPLTMTYIPSTDTTGYFEDTLSAPSVTQSILDSGVILTYADFKGNSGVSYVAQLSALEAYGFDQVYEVGQIIIDNYQQDYSTLPVRYVTIPGSKLEGNGASRKYNGYTIKELRLMSYEKFQTVAAKN